MSSVGRSKAIARKGALALLALPLTLAGCSTYDRSDIAPPTADFLRPPEPILAENFEHRLGPTDVVTVAVYRAPEFSGNFRLDASGMIVMPLIGLVPAQGKTTTELANDLRQRLIGQYYVNPDVAVSISESNSQQVVIDGSVNSPGQMALVGRTTLMEVVARAGGAGGAANMRRVLIFREIDGQRMVAAFDLAAIREAQAEDPEIFAQDIIIVDGSRTRQWYRDFLLTLPVIGLFRPFIY